MLRFVAISLCVSFIWAMSSQLVHSKVKGPRIINGQPANPGQFPWQVSFFAEDTVFQWFCGGSIISEEWILTAGHCVKDVVRGHIISGSVERIGGNITDGYEFILHDDFDEYLLTNDIGLIKLKFPLQFDANTSAVNLASEPLDPDVKITVSGWGYTQDGVYELSESLNYVEMVTISNNECKETYGSGTILDEHVCATYETSEDLKSICSGDSGGAAVVDVDTDPFQVGIASFSSFAGCESGAPSGFTRVAYYRDWIRNITGI